MKQIRLLTTAAIFLIVFAACKNNKLKVNEEAAKSKLLEQEAIIAEQKRIEEEKAKAFADSIAKLPKALRIKADRSIDKKRPPVVFDIEKARAVVKPIKYSQLGKKVSYIKLSHQFNKDFFSMLEVILTDKHIITKSLGGIICFNSDGTQKEIVVKNGLLYRKLKESYYESRIEDYNKYKGALGMPFTFGNKLYYHYADNANKQGWLMEYDMQQPAQINYNSEKEQQEIQPKGIRRTNIPVRKFGWETTMIALDKYHWTTNINKWQSSKKKNFLFVQNYSGDTVCQLKDFAPIKNYTGGAYRIPENTDTYRLNGHLHFRQNFNDTIYRFESVNRTVPLYVIDFGKKRIPSSLHGVHSKYSLKDKFVNYDLLETNHLVIVFYTQDYVCYNTAKKGTLFFNCFVYDKKTGEQYHAYINEKPHNYNSKSHRSPKPPHKGFINDLDYGITTCKWKLAEDGRLYKLLTGEQIKEHIKSNPKNSNLANKELLEEIANKAKDDDLFIMTISN